MTINNAPICTEAAPDVCSDGGNKGILGTIVDLDELSTNNGAWPYIRWWLNGTTGSDRLSLNALKEASGQSYNTGNRFYFTYNLNNSSVTPNASDIVYMKLELVGLDKDWFIGKDILTPTATGFGSSVTNYSYSTSLDGLNSTTSGIKAIAKADWESYISNGYYVRIAEYSNSTSTLGAFNNNVLSVISLANASLVETGDGVIVTADTFKYDSSDATNIYIQFDGTGHVGGTSTIEAGIYQKYTYKTYHALDGNYLPIDGSTITLNNSGQLQANIPTVSYPVTDVEVNGTSVLNGTVAQIPAIPDAVSGVNDGTN